MRKDAIDASALFLYRKPSLERPVRPLFLPAPPAEACESAMDSWLKEYREKLAEVGGMANRNPYATGKGARPDTHAPAAYLSNRSLTCTSAGASAVRACLKSYLLFTN